MKELAPIEIKRLTQEIVKQISKSVIIEKGYESKINDKDKINEISSILKNEIFKDNNYLKISFSLPTHYNITFKSLDTLCDRIKTSLLMNTNIYDVDGIFKEVELSYKRLEEWKNKNRKREEALRLLEEKEANKNTPKNDNREQDKKNNTSKKDKKLEEFENKLIKEEYELDNKNLKIFYNEYCNLLSMCDKFKINSSKQTDEEYCFNKILDLIVQSGIEKVVKDDKKEEIVKLMFDYMISDFKWSKEDLDEINKCKNRLFNKHKPIESNDISNSQVPPIGNNPIMDNIIDTNNINEQEGGIKINPSININMETICEGLDEINNKIKQDELDKAKKALENELTMIEETFSNEISLNEKSSELDKRNFLIEKSMKYKNAYEGNSISSYLTTPDRVSVIDSLLAPFKTNLNKTKLGSNNALFKYIANVVYVFANDKNKDNLNVYIQSLDNFEIYIRKAIEEIFSINK